MIENPNEPNRKMFAGRLRAEKSAGGRGAAPAPARRNFFQRVGDRVRGAVQNLRNRFRP